MFTCTRVYPNGDKITLKISSEEEKNQWVEYNSTWRFGCALFVNGTNVYSGYLSQEKVKEIESSLQGVLS